MTILVGTADGLFAVDGDVRRDGLDGRDVTALSADGRWAVADGRSIMRSAHGEWEEGGRAPRGASGPMRAPTRRRRTGGDLRGWPVPADGPRGVVRDRRGPRRLVHAVGRPARHPVAVGRPGRRAVRERPRRWGSLGSEDGGATWTPTCTRSWPIHRGPGISWPPPRTACR